MTYKFQPCIKEVLSVMKLQRSDGMVDYRRFIQ